MVAVPPHDTTFVHNMVWHNQYDLLEVCLCISPTLVNFQDIYGNTPYHYAIMLGRENCIDVLKKFNPNIALCNNAGQTVSCVEQGGRLDLKAIASWDAICATIQCNCAD